MDKGIVTSVRHQGEEEWNRLEGNEFQGCGVSVGMGGGNYIIHEWLTTRDGRLASGYPAAFSGHLSIRIRIRTRWRVSERVSSDTRPLKGRLEGSPSSRCKTQKVVVRPFLLNGEGDGGGASSALLYYQITRPTKLSLASFNQVIG
ncbi:uncharacterized protein PGTG_17486 [Puccinia graminis f. sp. tritici CRL 75-36-700-3]|uniref:Uncharacterized protein n=1 Tax=Puccinia graminis f. sp. tritici (strain CRL 75-36-700-3 / race SCCL) TaxID=418459 RepID=E3L5C4_PUCGT|nr:uncharacterized protein PGTG_17486 [Puccinia graminis f. sp. tritici CRL 75-36-700-3]EFP91749.1 hypothetical protein PGTG_17486 [Puccinia graminis f. sp. tritici CRL 75-36-700-3]